MRNHFIVFIFIFLVLSIFTRSPLYAYSASKHHKFMGEMASEESTLDEYLKNNLGFSGGINTVLTNPDEPIGEQTKTIKEWIGYGGIAEDKGFVFPLPRVARHFYDPVSNQGLSDYSPPVISSLAWGREQDGSDDDYSWARAREYYYLALTSETKEERERYWALTFRSLGQVLHLVQDLASPSHVRNDNHLSKADDDPYEAIWGTSPEGTSFIHAILAHGALGNADYQYPVVELDRFEDYWDSEDGIGLAEFTNSNFVSKDTNLDRLPGDPHHYDNPSSTGVHVEPFSFRDSNGIQRTVNVEYITSNVVDNYAPERGVNPFNYLTAVSYWNFYTMRHDPSRIRYTLNRKCHEEYAKLLVPRTVGYGAGLLNYFFSGKINLMDWQFVDGVTDDNIREFLEIHIETENIDLLKPGSSLIVYYDDYSDGDRYLFDTGSVEMDIISAGEAIIRINILNELGNLSVMRWIIVYDTGVIPSEERIIAGKIINIAVLHSEDSFWIEKYGDSTIVWNPDIGMSDEEIFNQLSADAYLNFSVDHGVLRNYYYSFPGSGSASFSSSWGPGSFMAGMRCCIRTLRTYIKYDLSFLHDFSIDSTFLICNTQNRDSLNPSVWGVQIYKDSSNIWPPTFGCGDTYLCEISIDYLEGEYKFVQIAIDPALVDTNGSFVMESRPDFNDLENSIPIPGPPHGSGQVFWGRKNFAGSPLQYLIIEYSVKE